MPLLIRIIFLDAFTAHHVSAVKELLAKRGFIVIKLGGGTTPLLCGLDVYLHAQLELAMIQLETVDFDEQQQLRPWKVPTRSRQRLVTDMGTWWKHFPHASTGINAFKSMGSGLALRYELNMKGY